MSVYKLDSRSLIIISVVILVLGFLGYQVFLIAQPDCYIYSHTVPKDQIDVEQDIIVHLGKDGFNRHPVLQEIILGEKPLSRVFILDSRAVDCREKQAIRDEYGLPDPFAVDYRKLVEWNGTYYELEYVVS